MVINRQRAHVSSKQHIQGNSKITKSRTQTESHRRRDKHSKHGSVNAVKRHIDAWSCHELHFPIPLSAYKHDRHGLQLTAAHTHQLTWVLMAHRCSPSQPITSSIYKDSGSHRTTVTQMLSILSLPSLLILCYRSWFSALPIVCRFLHYLHCPICWWTASLSVLLM